ncbi:MAG: Rnase Y domain-containing protein, partial [Ignavibacteria bacterium]|nr:Rnase Y domain-containing protein [Ignavibacteria bacterium]
MFSGTMILVGLLIAAAAFLGGWFASSRLAQNKITSAKEMAGKIVADSEKEAETLKREKLIEVKDEWYNKKKEFDSEVQSKRSKLQAQEKALEEREVNIDRKVELLNRKERDQVSIRKELDEKATANALRQKELDSLIQDENIR